MIPSRGKGNPEIDIETDTKPGGQNTRTVMDQLFDSTKSELSFLKPARMATKISLLDEGPTSETSSKSNEMVFEDIDDDFAAELSNLTLGGPPKPISADFTSKAITLDIAMGLKNLIFGQANSCFNPEWRKQGFGFKDFPGLEYGIVQHKGGPCGILASVQAIVLKHLILKKNTGGDLRSLQVSSLERTNALSSCLSEILWRCGDNKTATVALPSMGSKFMGGARYKTDGLTESLTIYSFKTEESLLSFARQNISQFENGSGVVLLLYSAIFSRTIAGIKSDMDEPSGKLLGAHGYCTQEMVNLLLTGKAHSNVFDNIVELDSNMKLRGLEKQSDIGLLSLFEYYGSCEVGSFYKNPKFPIWVVCSESHFSVLFSTNRNLLGDRRLERKFDLFYYDGLARQEEEIRLTVDTTRDPEYSEGDLVPPLELCIRTKWNSAYVDWNGSEPIL